MLVVCGTMIWFEIASFRRCSDRADDEDQRRHAGERRAVLGEKALGGRRRRGGRRTSRSAGRARPRRRRPPARPTNSITSQNRDRREVMPREAGDRRRRHLASSNGANGSIRRSSQSNRHCAHPSARSVDRHGAQCRLIRVSVGPIAAGLTPHARARAAMTQRRCCALLSTSPTSRRTPAPCCAWRPASAFRSRSSNRRASTSRTGTSGARASTTSISAAITRHASWRAFEALARRAAHAASSSRPRTRRSPYTGLRFRPERRASCSGAKSPACPDEVHAAADARIVVPMRPGLRSLNVAVAAAMILGEALRQTGGFRRGFPPAADRAHSGRRR